MLKSSSMPVGPRLKVTVKPSGPRNKNGSPDKTTELIYTKQIVDEYKIKNLMYTRTFI